jgi:hypothetical protein
MTAGGSGDEVDLVEDAGLLTALELDIVKYLGKLHTALVTEVIGDGPARFGDVAEVTHAVHVLQHAVMAQAAARAYPDLFRVLGGGEMPGGEGDSDVVS